MKVVIAGEQPLAADLLKLCTNAGHTASLFLMETPREAQTADVELTRLLDEEAQLADIAIECHNESKATKRRLIEILDNTRVVCASALACSTTEAASWAAHPAQVVGWGAVPPLEKGSTVEVAAGLQSSEAALNIAQEFWASLGLQTTRVADGPGLVRMRILSMLVNEAATALMDGVATPADIDTAMRLGTNYPRGPLAWGDLIGLDVVLGVMRGLQEEYGEDRYRPCPLLTRYAQAGRLGQKSGKGFFDYGSEVERAG